MTDLGYGLLFLAFMLIVFPLLLGLCLWLLSGPARREEELREAFDRGWSQGRAEHLNPAMQARVEALEKAVRDGASEARYFASNEPPSHVRQEDRFISIAIDLEAALAAAGEVKLRNAFDRGWEQGRAEHLNPVLEAQVLELRKMLDASEQRCARLVEKALAGEVKP